MSVQGQIDGIIRSVVFDIAIEGAKSAIIADVPWVGLPLISQAFSAILKFIGGYFYREMSAVGNFLIIDAQTEKEKSDYIKAVAALEESHVSGDPNAKENFKTAIRAIVHFDGAS